MDDDEYSDDSPANVGAAPMAIIAGLGQSYTNPEAHRVARELYDETKTERKTIGSEEDAAEAELERTAQEAKASLQAARQKMLARKYDASEKWLALAAALGKPTATGSFGETVGNAAQSQLAPNQHRREFEQGQEKDDLDFQTAITGVDSGLAKQQLELAKARRAVNARLASEALKTLSKEERPGSNAGSKPLSKNGKIALDENLVPGTPAYIARVKQLNEIDIKNTSATAGTDAPVPGDDAASAMFDTSHELGVPISIIDPYRGMSTKQKTAAMAKEQKDMEAQLNGMSAVTTDAQEGIADMDRFMAMNRKAASGPLRGLIPGLSDAEQTMDAITARVSRKMRQPGEGSTSDYDAKMFKAGTVSRTKNYKANLNVANAYKIMRTNEINRVAFKQDYATLNGHLRGADAAWREYLENNPIFDKTHPGELKLNPTRRDYKTYFREKIGDKVVPDDGDGSDSESADDVDPTALPSDYVPAMAKGGKISGFKKALENTEAKDPEQIVQVGSRWYSIRRTKTRTENGNIETEGQVTELDSTDPRVVEASKPPTKHAEGGRVTDPEVDFPEDDDPEALRKALYAALQGITAGSADEIRSTYDPEGGARDRAQYSDDTAESPWTRAAGLAAGALPLAALAAPGGGSLLQLAGAGAGAGAIFGATGADEDRGEEAAVGAGMGAVAGPALGVTAKYLYNKAGQTMDRARGEKLSPGEEKLVTAANRDKVDLGDIAQRLRTSDRLRVPEGVQDLGGRRTRALIERAAQRGGDPADEYIKQQEGNLDNSRSRVEDHVNRGLAPSEYFGEHDKLTNDLYTQAKPLYDKAYAKTPGVSSKVINQIMDTDDGKKAVKMAFRLWNADLSKKGQPIGKIGPGGMVQKPSLEFLDYVKRGFDQLVTKEESEGPTTLGRSIRGQRKALVDELDAASPDYKAARAQYGGDLEVRDALKTGREDFSKMAPEEVRRAVANMSFAEKDAFRSGASQHFFELLGRPSTDFNAAQKLVGSQAMREKLQATFDDPKKWKIFEAALDKESDLYSHTKKMLGRVEGQRLAEMKKGESVLSHLDPGMSNTPGMGGISPLNRIYNWLRFPLPLNEKTADDILKTVHRGDIPAFESTMKRLAAAQGKLKLRAKRSSKVAAVAAILGGALTQPTPPGDAAQDEAP